MKNKKTLCWLLCFVLAIGGQSMFARDVLADETHKTGTTTVFEIGTTLTISGIISGAPTGGTLNLSSTTLTLPAGLSLTTPILGVATATSINKVAITAPASNATLTIANSKTLTSSNTLTFSGTDGSTLNIGAGGTLGTAAFTASTAYAGSLAALTGHCIYVDSVNGSDSTGARGTLKPLLTLSAAVSAATSGDAIIVGPGSYTVTASLAKDGVNWHFAVGSAVTVTSTNSNLAGIWDDGGTAMSYTVTGDGDFTRVMSSASNGAGLYLIRVAHASSVVNIHCRDLVLNTSGVTGDSYGILSSAGSLYVNFRKNTVIGVGANYAIWWVNGQMQVNGKYCTSAGYSTIGSAVAATPTGDGIVNIDLIEGTNPIIIGGSNSSAAFWVVSNIVRATDISIYGIGSNRGYVTAQKIFGNITTDFGAGLLYVRADKLSALTSGGFGQASLLKAKAGTLRLTITDWDTGAFTGEAIVVQGGSTSVIINGGDLVSAAGNGLSITNGTARLKQFTLSTLATATANPITKNGGVLILDRCTLVAENTCDSITTSGAENVISYGTVANRVKNAGITLQVGTVANGGFVVDSNVQ
jgi:hypothetical protein